MSDNDLIRRGDVNIALDNIKRTYSRTHQEPDVAEVIEAINAIPAVSGEAVGYICTPLPINGWATIYEEIQEATLIYKDRHWNIPLYTTPQDQSALIAELKAQLARYEVVGEIALVKEDYASVNARLNENCPLEVGTKLFALMDEKWISCSKYLYRD